MLSYTFLVYELSDIIEKAQNVNHPGELQCVYIVAFSIVTISCVSHSRYSITINWIQNSLGSINYVQISCFLLKWNRLGYISNKAGQFFCSFVISLEIIDPISHSLGVSNSVEKTLTLSVHNGAISVLEIELLQEVT